MEKIFVTIRTRPLSPEDAKSSPWKISGTSISLANQSTKFEFDRIFGEECKSIEVYKARTNQIVASAVRGFNGTVFAYGQTNSGKTHTMRGTMIEPGIIPLAVHDLFESAQEHMDREFLVRMSYMEIYNEEINDLLAPEHRKLQIHESIERGIYVAGLREEIVASPEQVLKLMEFGESHRHIGETNMNLYSSRSHTIFRMIIESREKADDDLGDSCDSVRGSVLNLVDLAGSERAAKTGAEGVRLKEGSHINKSLMTLGTVIKKLSEGIEGQGGHVPYRDSKLTRILQPALGGNANTAIICNITLAQIHADETKSSLQFASRALRVTNCACVNEILTDAALLKRQRKEIEELRARLLGSHSEHWEKEILNLRNTLLQSALEKERIALELEEEKKAKAQRERRLQEQDHKIANLSSMVLYSKRDDENTKFNQSKRRNTWCPGPFSLKPFTDVSTPDQVFATTDPIEDQRNSCLPLPFDKLVQHSEICVDRLHSDSCLPCDLENNDSQDDFILPDACALLHVTNRKKMHPKKTSSLMVEKVPETESLTQLEPECTPGRTSTSMSQLSESASHGCKSLTERESEAIIVIKQLQDQIKSLEMEKISIQRNLNNVVDLATKQKSTYRDKYAELHQELLDAQEDARLAREELCSLAPIQKAEEVKVGSSSILAMEVQNMALEVHQFKGVVDDMSCIVEDLFQNFSLLSELLQELKSFASQDREQLKSVIDSHEKLHSAMKKNVHELETENWLLRNQSIDHQKQIQELESDMQNWERVMNERCLQHDMEKDELLHQLLGLQREVSCLSSSSLAREKETLRKELEKTKTKLKETESRLKNTIQDKNKLESEKAHAEREIKQLHGQRAILERDICKRDSITDRRRESRAFDFSKPKGHIGLVEQGIQADYQMLEIRAFEMEREIACLQEDLLAAFTEKEDAFVINETLDSELKAMSEKLNTANTEVELLKEEIDSMTLRLAESESLCKKLEGSMDMLASEKQEMAMQLTDGLLETETEKAAFLAKEKALLESIEKMKLSNEKTAMLSKKLLEEALSNNNKEKTKLRMRLRSTQVKLDGFRGRYKEAMEEKIVMDNKYKEASRKLKEKLETYGHEILRLQKQLAAAVSSN